MVSASVISTPKQAPCPTRPATNCSCAKTHPALNERTASATSAQRMSPEAQWNEIRCSNAKVRARERGPRLPRKPNSLRIIMDKTPSVEVLSRYSHPLLPTCCQHRRSHTLEVDSTGWNQTPGLSFCL